MIDLRTYYAGYRLRLIKLEQEWLEIRARHWIKGDHGYFAGSYSTGGGAGVKKAVDKSGKSDKMKYEDSSGNRIRITQKAIDSVPNVTAFSSDDLNQLVTDKCREILTDLKSDAAGTEETVSIKIDSLESSKRKGNPGEGAVKGISFDEPYISIHNHPSGETFSGRDIDKFAYDKNHSAMCVVGNNGKLFILRKTEKFNWVEFGLKTIDFQDSADYAQTVLKGADNYGLEYYKI